RPSWCVQTGPAVPNGIIAGPDGGRNGDGRPAGAGRPSPGRAGSAAQALTGLDVEEVHVALLRTEVDRLYLRRRTPAVDASDERLGDLVSSSAAAMYVGVGTELLDQIDLDRDALFVRDELEVLGAHAQGHGGLVGVGQGLAIHGQHGAAELHALVGELLVHQVHGG